MVVKEEVEESKHDDHASPPGMEAVGIELLDTVLEPEERIRKKMENLINLTVEVLIEHLTEFGACVIDDFLGEEMGNKVLEDILQFENFKHGELASSREMASNDNHEEKHNIRGDMITWTDGTTPSCLGIRHLIQVLDAIVITANRQVNNGGLGDYRIKGRTKAMVACYPGGGSHYVTHIDNPNRDGRCITAIYYINKNWNSKTDGGSLRIFSKGGDGPVAEIEPLFDRMLFFWSDRRNPHEVLPSFKNRFAVTLWYMDQDERDQYEKGPRKGKENVIS